MKNRNRVLPLPLPEAPVELNLSFERAAALAENVATPFLVLSESRIRERIATMRAHMPNVELFYAMKSNPDRHLLSVVSGLVDGIDVASYGEVTGAHAAGVGADRIIHSHPIKKESDIKKCVEHGVKWFTFDNIDEIPKLQKHAKGTNVMLRVAIKNPSCVVNLGAKFGAQESEALPLLKAAQQAGLNVRGISFHVGSQSQDPGIYLTAFRLVRRLFDEAAEAGIELDTLDIGGGFPVSYRTQMPGLQNFCQVVSKGLFEFFPEGVRVLAEPGRCISGDAMTLVVRVVGRSFRNGIPWYYIDDGVYGAFSGKVFDNCDYQLVPLRSGPVKKCVVAGPTCDSIDIVSTDQMLPDMEIGDLLVVPAMGAYTMASATSFNGFAPPVTVVDREDEAMTSSRRTLVARPRRVGSRVGRLNTRRIASAGISSAPSVT
jgi:ornithine decarboxylase